VPAASDEVEPLAMTVHVKICGITNVEDAIACVEEGASAIGLNFVPASPRYVDVATARAIADAVAGAVLVVGVVADRTLVELRSLEHDARLGCLQLHGDEPPELVSELLPHAYKAIRVAGPADVARAAAYPGEYVLVDAHVEGVLGGTGVRLDPALVAPLARTRKLTLAGGLTADNVASAVALVRPWAVDVASGVERRGAPRKKDRGAIRAFVAGARSGATGGP
jgi:phosphoribosylanthranilate isomerase